MYQHVPTYILRQLQSEPVDFIVESAHDYGKRAIGWGILLFSIFFSWIILWPVLFSFPVTQFFLTGHTVINAINPGQSLPNNAFEEIMFMFFPSFISVLILVPILVIIVVGIMFIVKKGGWYAATNKYLIEFNGKHVFYYLWDEFLHTIEVKKYTNESYDIILTHKKLTKTAIHKHGKLLQDKYGQLHLKLHDADVDLNDVYSHRGFYRNKIGLMKIQNGEYVLAKIREHIENFEK